MAQVIGHVPRRGNAAVCVTFQPRFGFRPVWRRRQMLVRVDVAREEISAGEIDLLSVLEFLRSERPVGKDGGDLIAICQHGHVALNCAPSPIDEGRMAIDGARRNLAVIRDRGPSQSSAARIRAVRRIISPPCPITTVSGKRREVRIDERRRAPTVKPRRRIEEQLRVASSHRRQQQPVHQLVDRLALIGFFEKEPNAVKEHPLIVS